MPTPRFDFEIYRGLTFPGYQLLALSASGDPVAQDAGTTYVLQARSAAGKPVAFSLPVERGTEAAGQILMPEVLAATTAGYPQGRFSYDLVPVDSTGKAWPPILTGIIRVMDSISLPQ